MPRENKLVFSGDGVVVRVVFKDNTETPNYMSKRTASEAILNLVREGKIEGEEFIKWLGLILSSQTLYGGRGLGDALPEEITKEVVLITENLNFAFFTIYFTGENKGIIFTKDGQAVRWFIPTKSFGLKVVKKLKEKDRIDLFEEQKLIKEINESTLPNEGLYSITEVFPENKKFLTHDDLPPISEN